MFTLEFAPVILRISESQEIAYNTANRGYTMTQRWRFTAEFKAQVVLDLISGAKSAAELCRQHHLNPQLLARWKTEFLERAPLLFEQDQVHSQEQERIAELERVVGRLTMQLEIAKKASALLSSQPTRRGG